MRLKLPASLAPLLPDNPFPEHRNATSIVLAASSWVEAVEEIRERFPALAGRLFGKSGHTAPGFVLVVNGVVAREGRPPADLGSEDEILFLPQIAGGR